MGMRFQFNLVLLVMMSGFICLTGCSMQAPDAGHEIVLIEKPWIWGHGGVVPEPVKTGLTITAFTTDGNDCG